MSDNELATTNTQLPDMYENAAGRANLVNVLIPQLLKCCHERDITDFGGKPYVGDSGCEKIARVAGISFGKPEVTSGFEEDENGKKIFCVTMRGEATIMGQTVYEVGGCDELDKFIASKRLGLIGRKLEVEKKAYCNWRGRCVRTLLGLSGLSWEDLKKQGVNEDNRTKVDFKEGRYSSDSKSAQETTEKAGEVKDKIRAQLLKDLDQSVWAAEQCLLRMTSFVDKDGKDRPGIKSVNDPRFSEKWAFRTWGDIKPDGKAREKYSEIVVELLAKLSEKALGDKDATTEDPERY